MGRCWLMPICGSVPGTSGDGGLPGGLTPLVMGRSACHNCSRGELTHQCTKLSALTTGGYFINDEESPLSQQQACFMCPLPAVASANPEDASSPFPPPAPYVPQQQDLYPECSGVSHLPSVRDISVTGCSKALPQLCAHPCS